MKVLQGEKGAGTCKNCGRKVAPRAMARHLKRVRTIRWEGGRETDVLADRSYGRSRWCDGSPEGVAAQKAHEELWEPCRQLHDVWDQVAHLWVTGHPRGAAAMARTCMRALRAAGVVPREKPARSTSPRRGPEGGPKIVR